MSDREEVQTYTVNRWDCPGCGEVHESDADLEGDDQCDSCGLKVVIV